MVKSYQYPKSNKNCQAIFGSQITQELEPQEWQWMTKNDHEFDPRVLPTWMIHEFDPQEWPTSLTHENDPRVWPMRMTHEFVTQEWPSRPTWPTWLSILPDLTPSPTLSSKRLNDLIVTTPAKNIILITFD